jgi:DNA-binding winged helix-turn-helix (wHTH) protein
MNPNPTIIIDHLDVKIAPDKQNHLRWKEYQMLCLLVQNSPKVVTREELINHIWKGTYCSDSTINQTIKSVRQKLGDNEHKIIKTIPRIGYFIEENQKDNIKFNQISSAEPMILPALGQPYVAPIQPAQSIEEDFFAEPIWVFPSHTRLSRAVPKPPAFRFEKLKKIFVVFVSKFNQYKNNIIFILLISLMLVIVLIYLFILIKITLDSHNSEWMNFNQKITAVTLSCPQGFEYIEENY